MEGNHSTEAKLELAIRKETSSSQDSPGANPGKKSKNETVTENTRKADTENKTQGGQGNEKNGAGTYEEGLASYLSAFSPIYTESIPGGLTAFAGGREEKLSTALAEYLYSEYKDLVTITQVDLLSLVAEDEAEITAQIELFSKDGESEKYLCTYNKPYGFYGIYPYTNVASMETEEEK